MSHDPHECNDRNCKWCPAPAPNIKVVPSPDQLERRNEAFKQVLTALGKPELLAEDREIVLRSACTFFDVPMKRMR